MGRASKNKDFNNRLLLTLEEAAEYCGIEPAILKLAIDLGRLKVTPVLGRKTFMINRFILEEYFYSVSEFRPDPKKLAAYEHIIKGV